MAVDGASGVHGQHNSPYRASTLVALLAAASLILYIDTNSASELLYGQLMEIGLVGLMLLIAMVSLSVINWFARHGRSVDVSVFKAYIALAISFVGIGAAGLMAFLRFDTVFGGNETLNGCFFSLGALTFVAGVSIALYFRHFRSDIYRSLGGILREDNVQAPERVPADGGEHSCHEQQGAASEPVASPDVTTRYTQLAR